MRRIFDQRCKTTRIMRNRGTEFSMFKESLGSSGIRNRSNERLERETEQQQGCELAKIKEWKLSRLIDNKRQLKQLSILAEDLL